MKAIIEIEKFDNGISLKWKDAEGVVEPENVVALERDKERAIGEIIWEDLNTLLDAKSARVVKMAVEYLTEEGEG